MKKLTLLALLPLALSCNKQAAESIGPAGSLSSSAVTAKQAANTTFTSSAVEGSNHLYTGTFSATGFLAGSGTTSESVNITIPASGNPSAMAAATYTFHSTVTFTFGSAGTITIVTNGTWAFTSNTLQHATGSGSWNVTGGTGAYASVNGNGSMSITDIDFTGPALTVTDIYTGYLQ